jgi:hypothetical protein
MRWRRNALAGSADDHLFWLSLYEDFEATQRAAQ